MKRFLAILLTVLMLVSVMPAAVFADELAEEPAEEIVEEVKEEAEEVIEETPAEEPEELVEEIIPETVEAEPETAELEEEVLEVEPEVTYVAQIGEQGYASLAEAIAAVPAGTQTTITMIADETIQGNAGVTVPAGKSIILDLNGFTVKNNVTESAGSQVILNYGALVITDTSAGKLGAIKNDSVDPENAGNWWLVPKNNYVTNVITNSGSLTIEAGNITNQAPGSICYCVDNQSSGANASLTINGGTLYNFYTDAIRMCAFSTVNDNIVVVNGGLIQGYCSIWIQTTAAGQKASLTINGGEIRTTANKADINGGTSTIAAAASDGIYDQGNSSAVSMTINGGVIKDNVSEYDAALTIRGGVFYGIVSAYDEGFVTGGTFNTANELKFYTYAYIEDGKVYRENYDYSKGSMYSAPKDEWSYWEENGYVHSDIDPNYGDYIIYAPAGFSDSYIAEGYEKVASTVITSGNYIDVVKTNTVVVDPEKPEEEAVVVVETGSAVDDNAASTLEAVVQQAAQAAAEAEAKAEIEQQVNADPQNAGKTEEEIAAIVESELEQKAADIATAAEEKAAAIADAIASETKVTGVELTTEETKGNEAVSGVQAIVDAAKEQSAKAAQAAATQEVKEEKEAQNEAVKEATKVEIEVVVNVIPEASSVTAISETETKTSASFKLDPVATVTAYAVVNEQEQKVFEETNVPVTNEMINQQEDITVKIFTGFAPAVVYHIGDDGQLVDTFTGNSISYDAATGFTTVIIHHFSELIAESINEAENSVAMINRSGALSYYTTLAGALAALEENDMLVLLDDCEADALNVTKSFKLDLSEYSLTLTGGITIAKDAELILSNANGLAMGGTVSLAGRLVSDKQFAISGDNAVITCGENKKVFETAGSGSWTYFAAAAKIVRNNADVYFETLTEASGAAAQGEKIILLTDINTPAVSYVLYNCSLDLAGFTVTAKTAVAFGGNISDSNASREGGLKVAKGAYFSNAADASGVMPVYTGASTGYKFLNMSSIIGKVKTAMTSGTSQSCVMIYQPQMSVGDWAILYAAYNSEAISGADLTFDISYSYVIGGASRGPLKVTFADSLVKSFAQQMSSGLNKGLMFTLNGNGLSSVTETMIASYGSQFSVNSNEVLDSLSV